MISKLPVSYPALPIGPIEQGRARPAPTATSWPSVAADRYPDVLKVTVGALITAIVVLAFVLLSQGIGNEGHDGVGPDRPPMIVRPVPAPAPSYGLLELIRG